MVQPASLQPESYAPPATAALFDLSQDHGEGPANRTLDELRAAFGDIWENDGAKWSMGQSLRFILATCGTFWIAAAALYYVIH
jgi:hypothetical protein